MYVFNGEEMNYQVWGRNSFLTVHEYEKVLFRRFLFNEKAVQTGKCSSFVLDIE